MTTDSFNIVYDSLSSWLNIDVFTSRTDFERLKTLCTHGKDYKRDLAENFTALYNDPYHTTLRSLFYKSLKAEGIDVQSDYDPYKA